MQYSVSPSDHPFDNPIYLDVLGGWDKDNADEYVPNNIKSYKIFLQISDFELAPGERNFHKASLIIEKPLAKIDRLRGVFSFSDADPNIEGFEESDPRFGVEINLTNVDGENTYYITRDLVPGIGSSVFIPFKYYGCGTWCNCNHRIA